MLGHMKNGELTIEATTVGFDEIPEVSQRLEHGGVIGRIVAVVELIPARCRPRWETSRNAETGPFQLLSRQAQRIAS